MSEQQLVPLSAKLIKASFANLLRALTPLSAALPVETLMSVLPGESLMSVVPGVICLGGLREEAPEEGALLLGMHDGQEPGQRRLRGGQLPLVGFGEHGLHGRKGRELGTHHHPGALLGLLVLGGSLNQGLLVGLLGGLRLALPGEP